MIGNAIYNAIVDTVG